jgi:DNA-binding LytR/AlgR family response regulator
MNLSIAIVEDEEMYSDQLGGMIESWSRNKDIKVKINVFSKASAFVQAFSQIGSIDAVFLDIYLEDGNGMDVAKQIRKYDPFIPIAFITRSNEYIGQGYDVWAMHYLIKPVSYPDVEQCMDRIVQLNRQNAEHTFSFKSDGIVRVLACKNILYFQSQQHYVDIHEINGEHRFRENINDLQNSLPEQFLRCSRSTIINLSHLYQYDAKTNYKNIILSDGTLIPVSDTYAKNVKERCFQLFL